MKKLIISEQEKKDILLNHGLITESAGSKLARKLSRRLFANISFEKIEQQWFNGFIKNLVDTDSVKPPYILIYNQRKATFPKKQDFLNALETNMAGFTKNDILRTLVLNDSKAQNGYLSSLTQRIRQNLTLDYKEFNKKLTESFINTYTDIINNNKLSEEAQNLYEGYYNFLVNEDFTSISKQSDQIRLVRRTFIEGASEVKLTDKQIKRIKASQNRYLGKLIRLVRSLFKDANEIAREIDGLIKAYEKTDRGKAIRESYAFKIGELLNQLEAKSNGFAIDYYKQVAQGLDKELKQSLDEMDKKQQWDVLRSAQPEDVKSIFTRGIVDFFNIFPFKLFQIKDGSSKFAPKWWFTRDWVLTVVNLIITGHNRTFKRVYQDMVRKSGDKKGLINAYLTYIFPNLVLPLISTFTFGFLNPIMESFDIGLKDSWFLELFGIKNLNLTDFESKSQSAAVNFYDSLVYQFSELFNQDRTESLTYQPGDFIPFRNTYVDETAKLLKSGIVLAGTAGMEAKIEAKAEEGVYIDNERSLEGFINATRNDIDLKDINKINIDGQQVYEIKTNDGIDYYFIFDTDHQIFKEYGT